MVFFYIIILGTSMKSLILVLPIIFLLSSCKDEVTKEDCLKDGKKYRVEKFLNLRTGERESRIVCVDK